MSFWNVELMPKKRISFIPFLWSDPVVLAETIKKIVGYEGRLYFNDTKPDGTMIKLTDPSKLHELGWRHEVELDEGITIMYEWYLNNLC